MKSTMKQVLSLAVVSSSLAACGRSSHSVPNSPVVQPTAQSTPAPASPAAPTKSRYENIGCSVQVGNLKAEVPLAVTTVFGAGYVGEFIVLENATLAKATPALMTELMNHGVSKNDLGDAVFTVDAHVRNDNSISLKISTVNQDGRDESLFTNQDDSRHSSSVRLEVDQEQSVQSKVYIINTKGRLAKAKLEFRCSTKKTN